MDQNVITVSQIKNGATYLSNHLSANDYYSDAETVEGEWWGQGADRLELRGNVSDEAFEALRTNRNPNTGEKLTARDGKKNAFHDITLSAPKSVSIIAVVGSDERVRAAFKESVGSALGELEKHAAVRDRAGPNHGTENTRTTGNVIAAVFHHDASRLLDPQLHAHAVMANATYDAHRERWYALQPRRMMEESVRITQHFRADLAHRVEQLGYKVQWTGQSFRIDGISSEAERQFSQRAVQRDRFAVRYEKRFSSSPSKGRVEAFIKDGKTAATKRFREEYAEAFGKSPTEGQTKEFVQDWRDSKLKTISTEEVRLLQMGRLTETTKEELGRAVVQALRRSGLAEGLTKKLPNLKVPASLPELATSADNSDQTKASPIKTVETAAKPAKNSQHLRKWKAMRLWRQVLSTQSRYRRNPRRLGGQLSVRSRRARKR